MRSHPAKPGEGFDAPPTLERSGSEVTIYISIHPLNRLYLKAIQEMLKIKNDWI